MVRSTPDDAKLAICRALGIDPTHVTGVNIRLRNDEIPTVIVRRIVWPPAPDADELATITQRFELVERMAVRTTPAYDRGQPADHRRPPCGNRECPWCYA